MIKSFPKHKTLLFLSQNKYNHNNMWGVLKNYIQITLLNIEYTIMKGYKKIINELQRQL